MENVSENDLRSQMRDFLVTRRERLTPEDVGIPNHGRRRVKGLRREEVALLAGVSVEYYTNKSFPHPTNTARFFFLDEQASRTFWVNWDEVAANGVAILRAEHGLRPNDKDLNNLIDELNEGSAEFRKRWRTHDVHRHSTGIKSINHPIVGRLDLPYENLLLPADPGLSMMIYNPAPRTPAHDALQLLRIWADDPQQSQASATAVTPECDTRD